MINSKTQPQALSPRQLRLRWLAGGLFLLAVGIIAGSGWLILAGCLATADITPIEMLLVMSSGLAFALLGLLIVFFRPDNRIGWLCLWSGATLPATVFADLYVNCSIQGLLSLPGAAFVAWYNYSLGGAIFAVALFGLLPLLYPNGRFLSVRWQWLTMAGLVIVILAGVASGLLPDFRQENSFGGSFPVDNPFGMRHLPVWWYPFFHSISLLSLIFLSMAGVTSMILRLKRSTGDERQQMKWLAYFLATAVTVQLLVFELPGNLFYPQIFRTVWYTLILLAVFWGFPLIIGIAIFKYRLYAIDLIIRRTLAYGVLSAILGATFLVSVVVLQSLFATATGQQSAVVIVISTLLIAALFNPLRLRVQGWIDRRFFRRKYDASQTLAAFAATARDEVDLDALTQELVRVMQETMQPAHVSVWLKESNATAQSRQDARF